MHKCHKNGNNYSNLELFVFIYIGKHFLWNQVETADLQLILNCVNMKQYSQTALAIAKYPFLTLKRSKSLEQWFFCSVAYFIGNWRTKKHLKS